MLFFKECKKVIFSLTFFIYLFAVGGFYFTQFSSDCGSQLEKPHANQTDYGWTVKEIPEKIMPSATESLIAEHDKNCYAAYPFGFYKEVKLSEKKNKQIAEIITEIENTTSYENFRELMKKADKIIGGGSKYSDNNILDNFSQVPKTYEDALAEYNDIFEKDKITGAYARLFCDYMGIVVSLLPVFVAVSLVNADRKSRSEQVIYTRKISSVKLIFTRFSALSVMMIIPVILFAIIATIQVYNIYSNSNIDLFAITRMSVYWLIPNILFSTAFGMFITELISPLIAIFLQGALWIASLMNVAKGLQGNINFFTLVCRHNSLYERYLFIEDLNKFAFNRIFYTVLAVLLVILTAYIYNLKRKGDFYAIRKHSITRKNKSKA